MLQQAELTDELSVVVLLYLCQSLSSLLAYNMLPKALFCVIYGLLFSFCFILLFLCVKHAALRL